MPGLGENAAKAHATGLENAAKISAAGYENAAKAIGLENAAKIFAAGLENATKIAFSPTWLGASFVAITAIVAVTWSIGKLHHG
jgi:hypothetical protein